MSINTTIWDPNNTTIRTEIWSQTIQDELQEDLMGQNMVQFVTDFPDGEQLTIPTLGSMTARNYTEGAAITIDDPTVGEFQLTIDKYIQSGFGVYDKYKQDTFYMQMLTSKFPEQVMRAIKEKLETDVFGLYTEQTDAGANNINSYAHRLVGSGTLNVITLNDIALAKLSLDKANVSKVGRVAVVDPTVSYQLTQIDNVIRQDVYGANSVVKDGFGTTTRLGTYLGFEFFESNMLSTYSGDDFNGGGIGSDDYAGNAVNFFMGNEALIGAMRLVPELEQSRDWKFKQDVYHMTSRYGLGLYRPEALVTLFTSTAV